MTASNIVSEASAAKIIHEHNGAKIIERQDAPARKRFEVIDPNGYHYLYSDYLQGAQDIADSAVKWGW